MFGKKKEWDFCPTATEAFIGKAKRNPDLIPALNQSIDLISLTNFTTLDFLNWVPHEASIKNEWKFEQNRLTATVYFPGDMMMSGGNFYMPKDRLPKSVRMMLAGKKLHEIVELPGVREGFEIDQSDIHEESHYLVINAFRDKRDNTEVKAALWALWLSHNKV